MMLMGESATFIKNFINDLDTALVPYFLNNL